LVEDENGDLLADSHNILKRWKNYFSKLLNVHGANDVRQREMHTAVPLVPEPEIPTKKLKRYELAGTNQIPAELPKQEVIHHF
jgi:hypothetical protein